METTNENQTKQQQQQQREQGLKQVAEIKMQTMRQTIYT